MSKILGFTNNGGNDWFNSAPYGNKEIQGIPDPEGGHALNAPTSIPSPFARMDLVRKSFENIIESPNLLFLQERNRVIASKEDEKLVSQCLDLCEILFNYSIYKNKIEIIEWDKTLQIDNLKRSIDKGHRRLGEALELFLLQDANTFNFNDVRSFYLVKYNHEVIGGTSPLTLFFSVGKDISNLELKSSKGKSFFSDIVPLYERDENFQKYLYLLFKSNADLGSKMKAFQEYLVKSLKFLGGINPVLFSELNTLNPTDLNNNYVSLNTNNAGQIVEVLGVHLKTVDPNLLIKSIQKSDFIIHSTKIDDKLKPLVLQNSFNSKLNYINANWDTRTTVPYKAEKENLELRKLPGQDVIYPYLTVSDFFEPNIIRLVYPINDTKYFDGNLKLNNPEDTKSYLLPLKPLFFKYFDTEDLINGGLGKPTISIDETSVGHAIRVQLKIPINLGKDYITFERVYHNDGVADEVVNKGAIKEHQFALTLFPHIKYLSGIDPYYKIQLIDRDVALKTSDAEYFLNFYNNTSSSPVDIEASKNRSKKQKGDFSKITSTYYGLNKNFDYIQVDNGFAKGVIIPKWDNPKTGVDQFTFAIDFGTTNTHVEYTVGNSSPKTFEITADEIQAVPLINDKIDHNFSGTGAIDLRTNKIREFIPEIITKDTMYNFPHRTVISQSLNNPPPMGGNALIDFNIPFVFEKNTDNNSRFFTNLKWDSKEPNNEHRVKAFLEQIVLMIRNKVIINGGNLEETKILWTYPTSMTPARKNNLRMIWDELYHKYFNKNKNTVDISESIAPYHYFKGSAKLEGLGSGISVLMDIGGGTSDVVVYKKNTPLLFSSYKFAGNTLFGDGYNDFGNITNNGLINKYKAQFDEILVNKYVTIAEIANAFYANQKSADFNTFLFSLTHNIEISDRELLDYNKKIANDNDLKIVFLYFYCAKVYHIAQLMKINELELPTNIIFSGNGSKILKIITPNQKLLGDVTKNIFLKVYNLPLYLADGLKINLEKEFPKELTSKGALMYNKLGHEDVNLDEIKQVYTCLEEEHKFSLLNSELNDAVLDKVAEKVKTFNDLFIDLNNDINFYNHFEISHVSFAKFQQIVNKHLKAFTEAGIEYNNKMEAGTAQPQAKIAETLFFYPMVETIQQLINELSSISIKED
ncbi:MAG: hypothetical protein EOP00_15310 [Pedobacter sp.]|nr:MAG: hypothetical protein EOP00_15310 [Pedobacter sp.]